MLAEVQSLVTDVRHAQPAPRRQRPRLRPRRDAHRRHRAVGKPRHRRQATCSSRPSAAPKLSDPACDLAVCLAIASAASTAPLRRRRPRDRRGRRCPATSARCRSSPSGSPRRARLGFATHPRAARHEGRAADADGAAGSAARAHRGDHLEDALGDAAPPRRRLRLSRAATSREPHRAVPERASRCARPSLECAPRERVAATSPTSPVPTPGGPRGRREERRRRRRAARRHRRRRPGHRPARRPRAHPARPHRRARRPRPRPHRRDDGLGRLLPRRRVLRPAPARAGEDGRRGHLRPRRHPASCAPPSSCCPTRRSPPTSRAPATAPPTAWPSRPASRSSASASR